MPLNEKCCNSLVHRRVFRPSCLYRDSGDKIAEQLVRLIENATDTLALNHLLLALAWTRSSVAVEAFHKWNEYPPRWASKLHVPPAQYLHSAGYCLDEYGHRRDLVSQRAFRLKLTAIPPDESVPCRNPVEDQCPSCKGPLSYLFDFTQLASTYFSEELFEAPRKVLCCLNCSCYGVVFASYREDGTAEWLADDRMLDVPYDGAGDACLRTLDNSFWPPFACAEPYSVSDATTLGGIPMWLQDAAYPLCVRCKRVMSFLAQHDNGPLHEEGIYYAFFCATCRVSAVSYQQT